MPKEPQNHCHCGKPIRKNAKFCVLHAAEHGMQYVKVVHGAPCARIGCTNRLPAGWKPRIKGSSPRLYCCRACKIMARKDSPSHAPNHRAAQSRYMASIRELERRFREGTA